ncbi:MAG: DNA-processing protein DprA [Proteobacteria bacterium]|nr:DNA-processing protein DprA [Pseudomonadota bacterium]
MNNSDNPNMQNNLIDSNNILLLALYKSVYPYFSKVRRQFIALINCLDKSEQNYIKQQLLKNVRNSHWQQAEEELEEAKEREIKVISITSELYPQSLRHIDEPPLLLFIKGQLDFNNIVAIVGSRRASQYGLLTAKKIAHDLSESGLTVISGLALGIDTAAHQGVLQQQQTKTNSAGRTIAVIGSGLNHIYPSENNYLAEEIITNNGTIISEYGLYSRSAKHFFPERNRIISGLSSVVVVAEASGKSGSLITARLAAEQGKNVFAIPGQINSQYSVGTNYLIKQGAGIFTELSDILAITSYNKKIQQKVKVEISDPLLQASVRQIQEYLVQNFEISKEQLFEILSNHPGQQNFIINQLELIEIIKINEAGNYYLSK